jgi:hypothetical protein
MVRGVKVTPLYGPQEQKVHGSRFRGSGFGFRVQGFGVQGFETFSLVRVRKKSPA